MSIHQTSAVRTSRILAILAVLFAMVALGLVSWQSASAQEPDDENDPNSFRYYRVRELRHMSDSFYKPDNYTNDTLNHEGLDVAVVVGQYSQDVINNVRGSRHVVCVVRANTGILDEEGDLIPPEPKEVDLDDLSNILIVPGGGYNGPVTGLTTQFPTPTDLKVFEGDGKPIWAGGNGGLDDATCFSWVSTGAGDQEISLLINGHAISWDTDGDGNDDDENENDGPVNSSLIKQWNVLENSEPKFGGTALVADPVQTLVDGRIVRTQTYNVTRALIFNPTTGLWGVPHANDSQNWSYLTVEDVFVGSHVTRAGNTLRMPLAGVEWKLTLSGCGAIYDGDDWFAPGESISGTTLLKPDGTATGIFGDKPWDVIKWYPNYDPNPATYNCQPGSTSTIKIEGWEPGPLGSGQGVKVVQVININFTTPASQKQVMLAWAGQRIILEADWRIPAGDTASLVPAQGTFDDEGHKYNFCPASGADATYVKGSGPGNFVPGLGAYSYAGGWANQATVRLGSDTQQVNNTTPAHDAPSRPQDACISRVLYESEDPGQVDIEVFLDAEGVSDLEAASQYYGFANYTKRAFVIYYMKFERLNLSLVTQVSKGANHNSPTRPDFFNADGVGNPWNAALDDADGAAEWNVSRDLLVRGRVSGWFVNANPSGRSQDATDPLNVLPANRWVLPQDWALLGGGPADNADGTPARGTAEELRPYYDIMFGPNQSAVTLGSPEGTGIVQAATVVAWPTGGIVPASANSATTFAVSGPIAAGTTVVVGGLTHGVGGVQLAVAASGTITNALGNVVGRYITLNAALVTGVPAAGTIVLVPSTVPFEGPYSLIDICSAAPAADDCFAASNGGVAGAALSNFVPGSTRDTAKRDGDVNMFDAPMPEAPVSVRLRGTGFLKTILKSDVYYLGTPNTAPAALGGSQTYPNPYYITNIPASPYLPSVVAGGRYLWDSWGNDGPGGNGQGVYRFWQAVPVGSTTLPTGNAGTNSQGIGEALTATKLAELNAIRAAYGANTPEFFIGRDMVLMSDNHGEVMFVANGDFMTDLSACAVNTLAGGRHCKPGDQVGTATISAVVDYPDFRGKHFPVASNQVKVTWTWGGYKDVTIHDDPDGNAQFKYVVFHAMDRDGFCRPTAGAGVVLLHSVLSDEDAKTSIPNYPKEGDLIDPVESVDFLIDAGEGIIVDANPVPSAASGLTPGSVNVTRQFATGILTFSKARDTSILSFPLSPLAPAGQTDECQAWIKVSNSLLGIVNILVIANDDEGKIGFDRIIDLQGTATFTLNFRWSLITWTGADNIPVADALAGTGANAAGNDISDQVTAVYGWAAASQDWLGYFPSGVNVPGANDLVTLDTGAAYWIAIKGPGAVTWTIATNVGQ